MAFEWDEQKRAGNLAKHGVDFRDIPALFDGDTLEVLDDRKAYGETRVYCLGEIEGRVYAVAYTWRSGNRRIISARKANDRETRRYYARHG
jgi:uncharacterized DUF497 family protein